MFWYIGNALDFRPRGPWFESGRLQQFFFFTFFYFWPFVLFDYHKIENRPPNSSPWRIKFLVRYGRWLFLKSLHIVFCEQYRRYFRLIFVDFGVCCSWDYFYLNVPHFFQSDVIMVCWWSFHHFIIISSLLLSRSSGHLSMTDHLLISLEPPSFFIFSLLFIFISSVHFFVHTFTRNRQGQFPSNFCQSSGPMISSLINFFKFMGSSWRHPGAIL